MGKEEEEILLSLSQQFINEVNGNGIIDYNEFKENLLDLVNKRKEEHV